jgi:hypothetical protein
MIIRLLIIIMCVGKIILWKLEDKGDQSEELANHLLPKISVECSNFLVILLYNFVSANILIC